MTEIDKLVPGQALTPEQKAALAKENVASSNEAMRLAAEHHARDIAEGKGEPAVTAVAGLLKKKLENGELEKNERGAPKND